MKIDMSAAAISARLRLTASFGKLWRAKGWIIQHWEVSNLDFEAYEDFIRSKHIVVIHFWAAWNPIDQEQREYLSRIDPNDAYDVKFGAVDIDDAKFWDLAKALKVLNVPALIFYKNGSHIETVIGLCSKERVEAKLNQLLKQEASNLNEPDHK
jgi:thioredoxin-like negative regulator of GroEL